MISSVHSVFFLSLSFFYRLSFIVYFMHFVRASRSLLDERESEANWFALEAHMPLFWILVKKGTGIG